MKNHLIAFVLTSVTFACSVPSSQNKFDGSTEDYACTTATGQIELTLSATALPDCVKLSDLPPEEAKLISETANSQNPEVSNKGTINIDRSKL
jgi:hypothetical protein